MNTLVQNQLFENTTRANPVADENKKLRRRFDRNENINNHAENALLLATAFGTKAEIAEGQRFVAERDQNGYLSDEGWQYQCAMNKKYSHHIGYGTPGK